MPENNILICHPVSASGYIVPGSIKDKCSECGKPVWIAPSSLLIIHDTPGMIIKCVPCVFARIPKEGGEFKTLTSAQIDEIGEYFRGCNGQETT